MTGCVIQARMGSKRFPGKMLATLQGKPILAHVIAACQEANVGPVVVATAGDCEETVKENEPLLRLANEMGAKCYRGSDENVLERVLNAAYHFQLDDVVRVCGDCPCVRATDIRMLSDFAKRFPTVAYFGFRIDGFPSVIFPGPQNGYPELVRRETLSEMEQMCWDNQEHVTYSLHTRPVWPAKWIDIVDRSEVKKVIDVPGDLTELEKWIHSNSVVEQSA